MIAEQYLELACEKLPVVNRIIREYGNHPLSDYLNTFASAPTPSYQQRNDFLDVVSRYISPLLGEEAAKQAVRDLEASPVILTANHLGVEYFSQFLQSNLMLALDSIKDNRTISVFSFGNIPLNNMTYPKGILIYHINPDESDNMPFKLSVFPDRLKRCAACVAPGFDKDMINKAENQLAKMVRNNRIPCKIADTIRDVFRNEYGSDSVMALPDYSRQCVILNSRIWRRLFSENTPMPELIYLEIEKIVSLLLEYDLSDTESLAYLVISDSGLRAHILEELDGAKGCWELRHLLRRITDKQDYHRNCGTVFFWGIDDFGRKIPLCLRSDTGESEVLRGIDDNGKEWEVRFDPETIIRESKERRLIPSLFTCFLVLSFARGLVSVGGYFQADYLPKMRKGLTTALRKSGYDEIARFVSQVPADAYLSGMLAVMMQTESGCLIPASTMEIIAGGGLTKTDIEKIRSLTVRDAHIAGLFETVPDVVPADSRPTGWKKELAKDCFRLLEGKVVVK